MKRMIKNWLRLRAVKESNPKKRDALRYQWEGMEINWLGKLRIN
jgi:hypothetical protein